MYFIYYYRITDFLQANLSLLPVISKLFEKLFLNRLSLVIEEKNLFPDLKFGFCIKHSTVEQVHRVVAEIEEAFENKEYRPAVFLDLSQAFDSV